MLVYNVHGLTHLAADAMRFGPLDTFSAFPFESCHGKIKQILRKPQFPLSQVIRRLSEMHNVPKVDTKLKKCSLKEEHTLGPLPFEFRNIHSFQEFSIMTYIFLLMMEITVLRLVHLMD